MIGSESRIVLEPADENVQVFYILDIVNNGRVPVNPAQTFAFDMPEGAVSSTVLEGSSPKASVKGRRVTVAGPFPPGRTTVQVACELPLSSGAVDLAQVFPATMEQLFVVVKKVGNVKLVAPQLTAQKEMSSEGQPYLGGQGGALTAGQTLTIGLRDLPHHSTTPRWFALGLAAVIFMVGALSLSKPVDAKAVAEERRQLVARREKLLVDLVRVEQDQRTGKLDGERYARRRADLIGALEQVYGELDEEPAAPQAGASA